MHRFLHAGNLTPWGNKSLKVFEEETLSPDLVWLRYNFALLLAKLKILLQFKRPPSRRPLIFFYTSSLTNRSVVYRNLRVLGNWLELLTI